MVLHVSAFGLGAIAQYFFKFDFTYYCAAYVAVFLAIYFVSKILPKLNDGSPKVK